MEKLTFKSGKLTTLVIITDRRTKQIVASRAASLAAKKVTKI